MNEAGEPTFVVVVDDDAVVRRGTVEVLNESLSVHAIALDHNQALDLTADDLREVSVALIDPGDPEESQDNFPGIAVARHLRAHGTPTLRIHAISGRPIPDRVKIRLYEVGVHHLHSRNRLFGSDHLHSIVAGTHDIDDQSAAEIEYNSELGITARSDIDAALRAVTSDLAVAVFAHRGASVKDMLREGVGVRRINRVRREFTIRGRIEPRDTSGNPVRRDTCSWRQVVAVYRFFTTFEGELPPR